MYGEFDGGIKLTDKENNSKLKFYEHILKSNEMV